MKNSFFDVELAYFDAEFTNYMKKQDRIERLVRKVEENPAILDTLETEELENICHYYNEIIRKNEKELAYLRNSTTE